MPIEPPPTPWQFPAPTPDADDAVALGADLAPGTMLAGYRAGLFPMHVDGRLAWWSPRRRGVLPVHGMRVTRSLRQSAKHFEIRVDTDFEAILAGCADPRRTGAWINDEVSAAYRRLRGLGWVHTVEAWCEGELAGGLYGVAIGGLFAGESMFSRRRDASKVALLALTRLLDDEYAERRLIDTQWRTPHLGTLGVVEMPRSSYLAGLQGVLDLPLPAAFAD